MYRVPKKWPPHHEPVAAIRTLLQQYKRWEQWKESQLCSLSWQEVDALELYMKEMSIPTIATRLLLSEQQVNEALAGATGKLRYGYSDYCAALTHLSSGQPPDQPLLHQLFYDRPFHLHPLSARAVQHLLATGYPNFRTLLQKTTLWHQLAHGCLKGIEPAIHCELRACMGRYRCLKLIMSPAELNHRQRRIQHN